MTKREYIVTVENLVWNYEVIRDYCGHYNNDFSSNETKMISVLPSAIRYAVKYLHWGIYGLTADEAIDRLQKMAVMYLYGYKDYIISTLIGNNKCAEYTLYNVCTVYSALPVEVRASAVNILNSEKYRLKKIAKHLNDMGFPEEAHIVNRSARRTKITGKEIVGDFFKMKNKN